MRYPQKWWVIVALLFAFALTVSVLTAQTETPSVVNAPSSAEVQADSVGAQASSDEPEQKQPTLELNRDTASADVENERRFNELRRELLDDRAKMIDWWLMFLAVIIPIIAIIGGIFSFRRFTEIKDGAQRHLEEVRAIRDKSELYLESFQATFFELQNRTGEAIEKWRSIANIAEGTNDELAADTWFKIGYLLSPNNVEGEDFEGAVAAYNKAIELNLSGPNLYWAYYNRGNAKTSLGQIEEATADYDEAIRLNPSFDEAYNNRGLEKIKLNRIDEARQDFETAFNLAQAVGNTDLMERARLNLENLNRGDAL